MIPLWMRNVISLCNAKGGKITSEEVANVAAAAGRYGLGSYLINALKSCRRISVEVVGETTNDHGWKIKIYRISVREIAPFAQNAQGKRITDVA